MNNITKEQYESAIPSCCTFRTYEEHRKELMLCWGLLAAIQQKEKMNCDGCEFKIERK